MVGPIYKKGNNYYQLLATGALEGLPNAWWEEVAVLQLLQAPWSVLIVPKDKLAWLEEVSDEEIVVMGREAAELGRFTP